MASEIHYFDQSGNKRVIPIAGRMAQDVIVDVIEVLLAQMVTLNERVQANTAKLDEAIRKLEGRK